MRLYDVDDYTRSEYTWDAFLRLTIYCTNIQGSALYDATLGDEELIEMMFEQAKARQSAKVKEAPTPETDSRPPRRGYSREVEAIYDLTDNIIALRAEMGRWPKTTTARAMSKRPWFPAEVVAERMRLRSVNRRDEAIRASQERWRRRNAAVSGT